MIILLIVKEIILFVEEALCTVTRLSRFIFYKTYFCGQRPTQFVIAEASIVCRGPKATTIRKYHNRENLVTKALCMSIKCFSCDNGDFGIGALLL